MKSSFEQQKSDNDTNDNYKWGFYYLNPEDKRLFVSKRIKYMGWTINFANPYSLIVITGIILLILLSIYIDKS